MGAGMNFEIPFMWKPVEFGIIFIVSIMYGAVSIRLLLKRLNLFSMELWFKGFSPGAVSIRILSCMEL